MRTAKKKTWPVQLPVNADLLSAWHSAERELYYEHGGPRKGRTSAQDPGDYPYPPYPSAGPTQHVRWILARKLDRLVLRSLDELRAVYWSLRIAPGVDRLPGATGARRDLEHLLCAHNVNPLDVCGWL